MEPKPVHVASSKSDLRRRILASRRRRAPEVRRAASRALATHLMNELAATSAADLAAFMPLDTEPPLLEAMSAAHRSGRRVWVPVVEPHRTMRWCLWHPEVALERGSLPGLREPVGKRHDIEIFETVGLLVVPAVAVGDDGVRLGFGGGYYDTFLERLEATRHRPRVVTCVFHDEILPAGTVPGEAHDAVLEKALTERGTVALNGRPGRNSHHTGAE